MQQQKQRPQEKPEFQFWAVKEEGDVVVMPIREEPAPIVLKPKEAVSTLPLDDSWTTVQRKKRRTK